MFREKATAFHGELKKLTLFPSYSKREYWETLPNEWKTILIETGKKRLNWKFSPISATLFMDFGRNGNRVRLEEVYFEKRYALADLILAECAEGKGRFFDDILNGIFSICEESAWQLPAHNTYIRDTPQELLPDITRPILDLFACETGALLAVAYALFQESFDQIHPFINSNLLDCLKRRILIPYLKEQFWWMGQGDEPMCNWTIWCTQNILLTAFLMPDHFLSAISSAISSFHKEQTILQQIYQKACQSIDYFLKDYGEDGCCDEGAQYYRHAGLCLFNTLEILNNITDCHFSDFYRCPKIIHIAEYILNVHIKDIYYVNYADCSPVAGFAGVREFLFGKRIHNPNMMNFAARDFQKNPDKQLAKEINLFYRIQNTMTYAEITAFDTSAPILYQDIFYQSVGVFIARDDSDSALFDQKERKSYYLAMKAGDNNDSHNHNDTGSFTIYKNGLPLFIDIGVETYTKKTFSPQRYELWAMQSQYHNLPTINHIQQEAGAAYRATDITYQLGKKTCFICMNIASAYPKEAKIASYIRKAVLVKGEEICITDTFQFTERNNPSLVLSFLTYEKPTVQADIPEKTTVHPVKKSSSFIQTPVEILIGTLAKLTLTGITSIQIEEIPITDERLKLAWKHEIYRIKAEADCQIGTVNMHIQ